MISSWVCFFSRITTDFYIFNLFSSIQSLSCVWLFVTPRTAALQAFLFITNSQSLLKLTYMESVMSSNHLILSCPGFLLPSMFPVIKFISIESVLCIRWPKYWSFSFSISPSNEYSGLISFRIDWLDLLAVQGDSQEPSPTPQFKSINQFSFQSQRKAMPKNAQTTVQLHSFHRLAK